jgi:hypothetical protein
MAVQLVGNSGITANVDANGNLFVLTTPAITNSTGEAWTSATALNTVQVLTSGDAAYPAIVIQLNQTSTLSAGAVSFEGTFDGINWITLSSNETLSPSTFAPVSNPYNLQPSTNYTTLLIPGGYQQVRMRLSTAITGTGTVTPYWSLLTYNPVASGNTTTIVGTVATQELKDTNRTYVTWFADGISSVTTEALVSIPVNRGGTLGSSLTTYTVTSGKTLRLQALSASITESTSTVSTLKLRLRVGSSVTTSSPVVAGMSISSSGVVNNSGFAEISIPDGMEIASGQQVGLSMVSGTTTGTVTFNLIGFEY